MRTKRTHTDSLTGQVIITDGITYCDGCNQPIPTGPFADRVTIQAVLNHTFPDGAPTTIHELDLCGICFEDRALPALRDAAHLPIRWRNDVEDGRVEEGEVEKLRRQSVDASPPSTF